MNYPLISEYVETIKSAEDNFEKLSYLKPVLGDDGLPVMTSGNFAVVFKMMDEQNGKFYAVKCFTKEQEGRAEAYREIAKELKNVSSPYILSIRYLEKELFVDTDQTTETEFPVLLMDWVEGKTLDKYLRENLDDKYALEMLAYRFSQLAQWLIPQPFAHGDLKPDNILVHEDGTLVLVDYDGMYVPAMKGQKARELGSPDFRHPQRTENDFDEHIDDFPIVSILLSLKAITINPLLFDEYGYSDRLLLSENDYRDVSNSKLINLFIYYLSEKNFALTLSLFITALISYRVPNNVDIALNDLHNKLPFNKWLLNTRVLLKDQEECSIDDKGVSYSKDGKRLIKGNCIYEPYKIRMGTETICDDAFSGKYYWDGSGRNIVKEIVIPSSVKNIGRNPFAFCNTHIICYSPHFVLEDGVLYTSDRKFLIGFYGDCKDRCFKVPEGVIYIGDYAFAGAWWLKSIILPSTLKCIGDYSFLGCQYLENIVMDNNIKEIGKCAFSDCEKLVNIKLPIALLAIGDFAFSDCVSIQSITIPSTVLYVGRNPFLYDRYLNVHSDTPLFEVENRTLYSKGKNFLISCLSQDVSFHIPDEVTHIGQYAFYGCPFRQLYIHDNINYIDENAFDGCYHEAFPYGYSMKLLVSKGRMDWAKNSTHNRLIIKEIDNNDQSE